MFTSEKQTGMFYLLHGNDEFTCREYLKTLSQQGNFAYNQDTYSGGEVDLMTITATCNTFPFLSDQRLVILEGRILGKQNKRLKKAAKPKKVKGEVKIPPGHGQVLKRVSLSIYLNFQKLRY